MAWYRLRVVARPGRRTAETVEVMVVSAVEYVGGIEADTREIGVDDRSLIWSNTPGDTTRDLPAGTSRFVDVAYVEKADLSQIGLQVGPQPGDGRHVVKGTDVTLGLVLTGHNIEASRYTVTINSHTTWLTDAEFPRVTLGLRRETE